MRAGAVTVDGLSAPLARTVNVAGSRTSEGGVEVVLGAVGGLVSGAVGGAPEAVSGPVSVAVVVAEVVVVVVWLVVRAGDVDVDDVSDFDDPHPAPVPSNTTHKRTRKPLTFAG
jgi:hypothetical protein